MLDMCLVIPCYNEAARLDTAAFEQFLRAHDGVVLYFVNDGSRDATETVLRHLERVGEDRIAVLSLPSNVGKAEAVRQGMLHAPAWRSCQYFGYWDADLATPLEEAAAMLRAARSHPECAIVLGLRLLRLGASIQRSAPRHYLGRAFATAASVILRLPVYDSQCGAKLLRSSVVPQVFDSAFLSRWCFDVEILARLRNLLGRDHLLNQSLEFPLGTWHQKGRSHLTITDICTVPLDLWKIERHYNRHSRVRP